METLKKKPGRPKYRKNLISKSIGVCVSEELYLAILQAAAEAGVTISTFVKECIKSYMVNEYEPLPQPRNIIELLDEEMYGVSPPYKTREHDTKFVAKIK